MVIYSRKCGILKFILKSDPVPTTPTTEQVEEVFAEDYDEPDSTRSGYHGQNTHEDMETELEEEEYVDQTVL